MASRDLFSPIGVKKEEKQNTEQYKVSFKDGKNGVYRSVIRFIPNYADPSRCTMIKSVYWVKNPITQKGMYVDDPRSVGQHSPVAEMYSNLYNTKIATYVIGLRSILVIRISMRLECRLFLMNSTLSL